MCKGCHGPKLQGGRIPGSPPDWPPAARLAAGPDSAMARYGDRDAFAAMLKTGKRPDGTAIAVMPFAALSQLNATETEALYHYLRRLAGLPN
jgi:mono/diheme cytochrome c family protein